MPIGQEDSNKHLAKADAYYRYSIPVDSSITKDAEYFCLFTPRIHRDAYLADAGSLQCQIDFLGSSKTAQAAAERNQARDQASYAVGCINPTAGNFTALCACEAIPDRLSLTTYMVEYAYIHDDVIEYAEDKQESELSKANQELIEGLDMDGAADGGSKDHVRRRQLQAKMAVEMMDIDLEQGKECLRLWKEMSQVFVEIRDLEFKTVEEYLPFRALDAGCPWTMSLLCFSMDFKLNVEEIERTSEVTAAAYDAWVLVNDYFSWTKEWKNFVDNGSQGHIVSAVFLFMRWRSVDWPEAKQLLRTEIMAYEQRYARAKEALRARGHCTERIEKWFDLLDLITAGNFAWSMTTARYDSTRPDTYPELRTSRQADWCTTSLDVLSKPISTRVSEAMRFKDLSSWAASSATTLQQDMADESTTSKEISTTVTTPSSEESEQSSPLQSAGSTTATSHTEEGSETKSETSRTGNLSCESYEEAFLEIAVAPYHYVESMPSKGVRSAAIDGLEVWYQVPEQSLATIRYIVNTLHSASLIFELLTLNSRIDDIQDGSEKRRGLAATHMVYGTPQTINSANLLMFKAVEAATQLSPEAGRVVLSRVIDGHIGQAMDLHWTRQTEVPTESEYFAMVDRKTGGLFVLLAELMRSEATMNKDVDLSAAMMAFGRFFQARDDYQNIQDAQYTSEKGFADDINEGKMSLPMIHALSTCHSKRNVQQQQSRLRLMNIFQQRKLERGLSHEAQQLAIKDMETCGAFESTKRTTLRLQKEVDEGLVKAEQRTGSKNWLLRLVQKRLEV